MSAEKKESPQKPPAPAAPATHVFAVDAPPMPGLVKPVIVIIPVDKSTVQKIVEKVKDL